MKNDAFARMVAGKRWDAGLEFMIHGHAIAQVPMHVRPRPRCHQTKRSAAYCVRRDGARRVVWPSLRLVRRRGSGVGSAMRGRFRDRKSTRLNSSHVAISYAVFCLKKKTTK